MVVKYICTLSRVLANILNSNDDFCNLFYFAFFKVVSWCWNSYFFFTCCIGLSYNVWRVLTNVTAWLVTTYSCYGYPCLSEAVLRFNLFFTNFLYTAVRGGLQNSSKSSCRVPGCRVHFVSGCQIHSCIRSRVKQTTTSNLPVLGS